MKEYIERAEVLKHKTLIPNFIGEYVSVRSIIELPAADVAPVRHGWWKRSGHLLECQSCGEIYSQLGGNAGKAWRYCPSCGATMDLEVSV